MHLFFPSQIKVPPGPLQADRHPLRHGPGLGGVRACPHEGTQPFREGQHVFPNVANDQPKQRVRKQRGGVASRHSEGTVHGVSRVVVSATSSMLELLSPDLVFVSCNSEVGFAVKLYVLLINKSV